MEWRRGENFKQNLSKLQKGIFSFFMLNCWSNLMTHSTTQQRLISTKLLTMVTIIFALLSCASFFSLPLSSKKWIYVLCQQWTSLTFQDVGILCTKNIDIWHFDIFLWIWAFDAHGGLSSFWLRGKIEFHIYGYWNQINLFNIFEIQEGFIF